MNIEVEIKVKVDNLEEVKSKLKNYGKLVKSIKQVDEYYVPYHRDFFAQKPLIMEWLRIRTNPDKTLFEYDRSVIKSFEGEQWYTEEYETEILRPAVFKKILKFLNFKKVVTIEKKRELWDCGDFEICLDKVKDLGFFVEVELKKSSGDLLKEKKRCHDFLRKLGVKATSEKIAYSGYPVLFLESKAKNRK